MFTKPFLSLLAPVLGQSPIEGCNFVGFRLIKIQSLCVNGFCSKIRKTPDNRLESTFLQDNLLPCSEAESIALDILRPYAPSEEEHVRKRARTSSLLLEDSLRDIADSVCLAIMNNEDLDGSVISRMKEVDEALLKAAASASGTWGNHRELLLMNANIGRLFACGSTLLKQIGYVPNAIDTVGGPTGGILHFLYDLFSVVGVPPGTDMGKNTRYAAKQIFRKRAVLHRPLYANEVRIDNNDHSEISLRTSLMLAQTTGKLSDGKRLSSSELGLFVRFVSSLPSFDLTSTSRALLWVQFQREICPKLKNVIDSVPDFLEIRRIAISVIHHCTQDAPLKMRFEASFALENTGPTRPRNPLTNTVERIARDFHDSNNSFVGEFEFPLFVIGGRVKGFAEQTVTRFLKLFKPIGAKRFKSRTQFESGTEFEHTMTGLGRVLGFAALQNAAFGPRLKIDQILLTAIHRPVDRETLAGSLNLGKKWSRTPRLLTQALNEFVHEPVWFIRAGIRDVLGPAGIYAISDAEWDDLLIRPKTNSILLEDDIEDFSDT
jgi:hypothetical protein